jgi:hypothetical protein
MPSVRLKIHSSNGFFFRVFRVFCGLCSSWILNFKFIFPDISKSEFDVLPKLTFQALYFERIRSFLFLDAKSNILTRSKYNIRLKAGYEFKPDYGSDIILARPSWYS